MPGLIHKREEEWADEVPFASLADVSKFAAEFDAIISEALPGPPVRTVLTGIDYSDGKTGAMTPAEFHDTLPDLAPLAEAGYIYLGAHFADENDPEAKADRSDFVATVYITPGSESDFRNTRLRVEGRKLTTVEGVKGAAKAAIDRHAKAKREAEEDDAERERQAESNRAAVEKLGSLTRQIIEGEEKRRTDRQGRKPGTKVNAQPRSDQSGKSEESRWRRFFYNPWTVTVGGGLIVGLIFVLATQA